MGILNRCHLGDCRDLPVMIEPGTVDLIIADPPYGETSLTWDRWPDIQEGSHD